jgi:uncharacterized protein (DUF3820 family)
MTQLILTHNSIMPYGKYNGHRLKNVPAEYLLWIFENNKTTPQMAKYINRYISILNKEKELRRGLRKEYKLK